MTAIFKRELKSYLTSMVGYLFIFFVLVLTGIYFSAYQLSGGYSKFETTLSALTFVFLIGVPILSMRVLAEERKQKTDQLSYASAYTGILGFFLLGCANLAIGVFMSALTESQVIAAVLTFVFLFAFYMMNGISSFFSQTSMSTAVAFGLLIVAIAIIIYTMIKNVLISVVIGAVGEIALVIVYVVKSSIFQGGIQKVLNVFNLSGHYDNFTKGVFDVTGIVYFISVIAICLFLTMQSIQKRRWN